MTPELITEILPLTQRQLLKRLEAAEWLVPFYLAGGTALALQLGHRQSADFDFFSEKEFDNRLLASRSSGGNEILGECLQPGWEREGGRGSASWPLCAS